MVELMLVRKLSIGGQTMTGWVSDRGNQNLITETKIQNTCTNTDIFPMVFVYLFFPV